MNTMNMPGFTAGFSLSQRREWYQMTRTQEVVSDGMKIIPQRDIKVICAISADGEISCGYHDYDNGISVVLF
jgi:hypothetical protein